MGKKKRKFNFRDKPAKKPCPVESAGITEIDYKDIELLKNFLTTKGKIIPRRITSLSSKSQKTLTRAIKQARNAALLSFAEGYVPQDDVLAQQQAEENKRNTRDRPPREDRSPAKEETKSPASEEKE